MKRILKYINKGQERSVKAKKNIIASLFIKGSSILIGFILVPITLNYLDTEQYGIWLTISSFLTWFTFFQIGLGNGLRNKLAESLAIGDFKLSKIYVSTTYALLAIITTIVGSIFIAVNGFIDWTKVLNTDSHMANELSSLALIVFSFFFLRFVLKLIGMVLIADQKPALSNLLGPLGNLLSLVVIYILTKTTNGSLIYLGFTLSLSPIIILILASVYFYNTKYRKIAPSIKFVKFKYAKDLLGLGFQFFLIQISALVLFQSSNIIIAQFFGPAEVTPYNIAFKYFSIINMLFVIIMTPFWSAHTEAWVKKDFLWIKKSIRNLLKVWIGFVALAVLLFVFSTQIFDIWIGKDKMAEIHISQILKLLLLAYFLTKSFGGIFTMFINGVGKVRLQMVTLLIGAVLFVPLSIIFIKFFHMGIEAVVLATLISNIFSPLIAPLQYYRIINNEAHGIWNK